MRAAKVTAGLAESSDKLLLGIWRDSLHVTCGLTACTPGSAPGPTLGNEYGKTLPFLHVADEKLMLKIHILIPIVQPLLENVDRRSLDNNISIAIIWFLFSLFVSLNISGSQHQAPTKDISTPADIALSALETLFCCFMGYISQGLF